MIEGLGSLDTKTWFQIPQIVLMDLLTYARAKVATGGLFTEREAAISLMLDKYNGNKVGQRTYAEQWGWTREQVRQRLDKLNALAAHWCASLRAENAQIAPNLQPTNNPPATHQQPKNTPQNALNEDLQPTNNPLTTHSQPTSNKDKDIYNTYLPSNHAPEEKKLDDLKVEKAKVEQQKSSEFALPDFNFSVEEIKILSSDRAKTVLAAWIGSGSHIDYLYQLTFGERYHGEHVTYKPPNGFERSELFTLSKTYQGNELATAFICASAKNFKLNAVETFIANWKSRPSEQQETKTKLQQPQNKHANAKHYPSKPVAAPISEALEQAARIAERIKQRHADNKPVSLPASY